MTIRILRNLLLLFVIFVITACSTNDAFVSNDNDSGNVKHNQEPGLVTKYLLRSFSCNGIWKEMRGNLALSSYANTPAVNAEIHWFQHHQSYLNKVLTQSTPYIYYIYQETKQQNLPAELALIPIIESAYNPFLYSRTGATGLWQMMPGTASGFGLKINWWYDGRRDLIASTKAALKYITYLNDFFDKDWLLAIAAYDAGEGKVQSAVMANKRNNRATDFWSLKLPKETKSYVPRLLALSAIINDPERYQIDLHEISNDAYFTAVDVGSQIDLGLAAKLAKVDLATMRMLNPGFRRWATDPDGPFTILVPINRADEFKANLADLPKKELMAWKQHTVRNGENLITLAKEYHADLALLRKINELKNNRLRSNQIILIPITPHEDTSQIYVGKDKTVNIAENKIPGPQQFEHEVMNGETMLQIAHNYQISIRDLIFWNKLDATKEVEPGVKLVIWKKVSPVKKPRIQSTCYRVKSGDNLPKIAKRFHTTTQQIKKRNHLRSNSLKLGQKLIVESKSSSAIGLSKTSKHAKHHSRKVISHSKKHQAGKSVHSSSSKSHSKLNSKPKSKPKSNHKKAGVKHSSH